MANYQRSKIRIYPNVGKIDIDNFKIKIEQLKVEHNIYETINVFYPENLKFGELHFTSRKYPHKIDEIFSPKENDLWIITADGGGGSDFISFETRNKDLFWGFTEKAIYSFDEIRLIGERSKLKENIIELFGVGVNYINKHEIENGIKIHLNCLYTANNFFYNEEEGKLIMNSFEKEDSIKLKNMTGEFWDMLFHIDGINFKENFYRHIQQRPTGINEFPYLRKIEFFSRKRLTNKIEWSNDGGIDYWKHYSNDGFWNCINSRFFSYELIRN